MEIKLGRNKNDREGLEIEVRGIKMIGGKEMEGGGN